MSSAFCELFPDAPACADIPVNPKATRAPNTSIDQPVAPGVPTQRTVVPVIPTDLPASASTAAASSSVTSVASVPPKVVTSSSMVRVTTTSTPMSSSISSPTVSAGVLGAASTTPTAEAKSGGSSTVGIAVGAAAVGILALVALAWIFVVFKRKRARREELAALDAYADYGGNGTTPIIRAGRLTDDELPTPPSESSHTFSSHDHGNQGLPPSRFSDNTAYNQSPPMMSEAHFVPPPMPVMQQAYHQQYLQPSEYRHSGFQAGPPPSSPASNVHYAAPTAAFGPPMPPPMLMQDAYPAQQGQFASQYSGAIMPEFGQTQRAMPRASLPSSFVTGSPPMPSSVHSSPRTNEDYVEPESVPLPLSPASSVHPSSVSARQSARKSKPLPLPGSAPAPAVPTTDKRESYAFMSALID